MKREAADVDPFEVFDADDAPAALAVPAAPTAPASASLYPLVQSFVAENLSAVASSLREPGDEQSERLAALLEASARAATAGAAAQCQSDAMAASSLGWEALQRSGTWPGATWREAFVLAQLLLCWSDAAAEDLPGALRRLDTALILGGPSALLANAMQTLEQAAGVEVEEEATEAAAQDAAARGDEPAVVHPIETSGPVSADEFAQRWWRQNKPVVVQGAMAGWRAMRRWRDLGWLRRAYGERLVPVELGSLGGKLTRSGRQSAGEGGEGEGGGGGGGAQGAAWSERLMRVAELVDRHLRPEASGGVAYLAQHPLFEQLPRLKADYAVPPYCALGRLQHVNAWLGTGGTVTPLHFDSYDNLLAQVVGTKYVRLYAPAETPKLYVRSAAADGLSAQGNVSEVDVEAPDLARHPRFAEAAYEEVVLRPGEMLFIPARTWHYVRGLSTSWSVSFWF